MELEQQSVYQEQGYESREHYLECMADEYGLSVDDVKVMAFALGPEEDFDALVSYLEDACDYAC